MVNHLQPKPRINPTLWKMSSISSSISFIIIGAIIYNTYNNSHQPKMLNNEPNTEKQKSEIQ